MLVLSRKVGESVMIGDQIELIVLGTEGDTVKLGIIAPQEQRILRKEIHLAIKEANKEASDSVAKIGDLSKFMKKNI
ncbi:carbon storage regulator CsrA [Paenibacillus qinlingensis]|uniref:Translational regulator CsrA n=1 Tax=Paenibacillus qinlingensis TaxID=1837343 RepID=A0ABU1P1I4_9BACL|nr:carbon storage regulator CsrA [Paenibacillus qinlingensis]MDR6553605.1 carbon storage regulator [Paenibacillus qinlingensis]